MESCSPEFEQLAQNYHSALERLARRIAGSADDAQDLLQESLIDAYRGFHRFRPGSNFYTWVGRIMINNQYDRAARKRIVAGSLDDLLESSEPRSPEGAEGANPESALLDRALDESLAGALATLPPNQRTLVELCDLGGETYEEAARKERCPVGTVRSRLHRAHHALKALLASAARPATPTPPMGRTRRAFLSYGAAAALGSLSASESSEATPLISLLTESEGFVELGATLSPFIRSEEDAHLDPSGTRWREADLVVLWQKPPQGAGELLDRVRSGKCALLVLGGTEPFWLRDWETAAGDPAPEGASHQEWRVCVTAPRHPVAAGIEEFHTFASDRGRGRGPQFSAIRVLEREQHATGQRAPYVLAGHLGKGRVLLCSADAADIRSPNVQRLLQNAAAWCLGRCSEAAGLHTD